MMFQGAVQLFTQDYLGKEKYLQAIGVLWIDTPWWPWVIIGFAAIAGGIYDAKKKDA